MKDVQPGTIWYKKDGEDIRFYLIKENEVEEQRLHFTLVIVNLYKKESFVAKQEYGSYQWSKFVIFTKGIELGEESAQGIIEGIYEF
jgi:hypothetical protein